MDKHYQSGQITGTLYQSGQITGTLYQSGQITGTLYQSGQITGTLEVIVHVFVSPREAGEGELINIKVNSHIQVAPVEIVRSGEL